MSLKDAKYIVFIEYCDPAMDGFETYEDALAEVERRKTDNSFSGKFVHYIVKVLDIKTIEHR